MGQRKNFVGRDNPASPYAGKPLQSKRVYFWKVRVWDENDHPSSWSEQRFWSMGLLEKSEWAAKWISDPSAVTTPQAEAESIRGVNSGYRSQSLQGRLSEMGCDRPRRSCTSRRSSTFSCVSLRMATWRSCVFLPGAIQDRSSRIKRISADASVVVDRTHRKIVLPRS